MIQYRKASAENVPVLQVGGGGGGGRREIILLHLADFLPVSKSHGRLFQDRAMSYRTELQVQQDLHYIRRSLFAGFSLFLGESHGATFWGWFWISKLRTHCQLAQALQQGYKLTISQDTSQVIRMRKEHTPPQDHDNLML